MRSSHEKTNEYRFRLRWQDGGGDERDREQSTEDREIIHAENSAAFGKP
jgi:hypothetical protein